ncbi:LysR family transcriptional regulator [Pigmentiphaga aceris]|uniref:LysR family transcriptional regulator n=1 Tax=Pigmentiphaga aceris TaxID=1940612 RepID=A0A5C0B5V7_9BURK|nr:LysR family transcriptional regulator [Pigmentiphaga aceris]QEI08241.1 LysR family transcriptional regulator [Pigmentiphaga aceris]
MPREHYSELLALIAVARERSFTRAAAQLGMSQSMLSHTIREMEARLGVRLLTRTTRSVSVTEAGERLLDVAAPRLKSIEAELRSIAELRDVAAGTIRITATDHAIDTVLWPKISGILAEYPQIKVEMSADYALVDIVQGRYDFGVRLGDELAKDISAVRIGPDMRAAIVGAPAYFASHPMPTQPQDLVNHDCINLRLPTRGNLYSWELKKGQREMSVRVEGRLVFNGIYQILNAALSGNGLAYVPEDLVQPHLASGALLPVLKPWWRKFPGLHLFYSRQRGASRAMRVLIDALEYKKS